MEYTTHSGYCCGISTVYGFDDATVEDLDAVLRRHDHDQDHGTPGNRLLEAVLTDRQLAPSPVDSRGRQSVRDAGGWSVVLASRGFVLHTRFRNSNTQSFCNVFHRVMTRESIEPRDLPFSLEGFREPSTPEQPEQEPILDVAAALAPTIWSEDFLSPETARIGLRVQYRHRQVVGTSRALHDMIGHITSINDNPSFVTVRWDEDRNEERYRMNRFVFAITDATRLPEPVPETEPDQQQAVQAEPAREPVISTTTQYYAIRRDGTRAGPFQSERQARDRWSRVREYVRIDTTVIDGEINEIHETIIAA